MRLSTRVLGTGTVRDLTTRAAAPVLIIGKDAFTRTDLARVACFNFHAAAALSAAAQALDVLDTADLFDTIPPAALVLPHIGPVALAVLGAAFELRGLGGGQPLESWVAKHRAVGARDFLTFHTLKARARHEAAQEVRGRKQRRSTRRNTAQRLRVGRFLTRHGDTHAVTTPARRRPR